MRPPSSGLITPHPPMPPAPFDPCRQWLGIDAVDLVDPRRVLGLAAGESDPLAVVQAAEARLDRLRNVAAGPAEAARVALLKRVEEARAALLAQLASSRGPAPQGRLAMPPPPGGVAAPPPAPAAGVPVVPPPPAVPTVPRPPAPAAWPDGRDDSPAGETGLAEHEIRLRPTVVYRKQSGGGLVLLLVIAALAAAAAGLYWLKFKAPQPVAERPTPRERPAAPPAVAAPAPSAKPGRERREERFGVPDRAVSTDAPPDVQPARRRKPRPPDDAPLAQAATPALPPRSAPEPAADARNQPPARQMTPPPAPSGDPQTPAEDARRVEASLARVRDALRDGDFAAAGAAVKDAAEAAATNASRTRVGRWEELVTFAKGFAGYRDQALATVVAGQEYDIDDKKVIVVEVDDRKFVYRYAGKNKTTPRDRIPGGIVMAIVTAWFDDNPANDLYVGAYHATKAEPAFTKARAAWEKARAAGADASALLPLLDDPVLTAAAGSQ